MTDFYPTAAVPLRHPLTPIFFSVRSQEEENQELESEQ